MRSSGSALAVSMQIGMLEIDLSSRASSRPLSPGIITSRMTKIEGEAAHGRARARRIGGGADAEAVLEQVARQQIADALVVVDDQDVRGVVGQRVHAPPARCGAIVQLAASRGLRLPLSIGSGSSASTSARSSLRDHVEQEARPLPRRSPRPPAPAPAPRAATAGCRGGPASACALLGRITAAAGGGPARRPSARSSPGRPAP